MDDSEKRSVFAGLYGGRPPLPAAVDADSSSESDDADSPVPAAPPSPAPSARAVPPSAYPRPPRPASPANSVSSDASTVKPPSTPGGDAYVVPDADSSDADTLPPPSPPRQRVTPSPPRSPARGAVAVRIVRVDGEGDAAFSDTPAVAPPTPAGSYPRFLSSGVRFTENSAVEHVLSDQRDPPSFLPRGAGALPPSIVAALSKFQLDGVTFMYRLYERGRGGLLADAMGLGKTVQAICFIGAAFGIWDRVLKPDGTPLDGEQAPRVLVIAPTTLRDNWRREFETWSPMRVRLYSKDEEPSIARALRGGLVDVLISGDNPVGNYGDGFFSDPTRGAVKQWRWDIVIVDEIHVAKNSNTKIYKALSTLPKYAMFGLTGTAVQNKLKELWNLLSLVVPRHLLPGYSAFRSYFVDIINRGSKKDARPHVRQMAKERIARLRLLLAKHMVRRPKSVIEDQLPDKTDYCVLMRMERDGLQGHMYRRFQNSYDVKMLRDAKQPCDCGSRLFSKDCCHRYPRKKEHLMNAPIWKIHHRDTGQPCKRCPNCICLYLQHYSRFIAGHAFLLTPEEDETDEEKVAIRKELLRYYLGDRVGILDEPLVAQEKKKHVSCKLNVAFQLIKSYQKAGHKTIIFYESLRLGKILQRWATNKLLSYEVIDGSVNKGERQGAVDRFNKNTSCSIFFISKKAGGTGLNICGADRVLIFEPCWNPTLDLQAGDRAYRLGQKRVVHIIRFVVENTIEHYVLRTAISKTQVSNAILDNTREEWHIKEDEVGSMQAMLSMGDAFGDNIQSDEFNVLEADELVGSRQSGMAARRGFRALASQSSGADGDEDDTVDIDLFEDKEIFCADVEVTEIDIDIPEERNASTGSVKRGKGSAMPESQAVSDLLDAEGASRKMIMTSTSARKRKHQMMGVHGGQRSGINPDGPRDMNFDDAGWDAKDIGSDGLMDVGAHSDEEQLVENANPSRRRTRFAARAAASAPPNPAKPPRSRARRVVIDDDLDEFDEEPQPTRSTAVRSKPPRAGPASKPPSAKPLSAKPTAAKPAAKPAATKRTKPAQATGAEPATSAKRPASAFAARARVRR